MKNYAVAVVILLVTGTAIIADPQEVFSRSFMFTRPLSSHLSTHQALWHDIIYNKKGPIFGAAHFIAMYQQSISLEKTARYFLPNCKNELLVSGDNNTADRFKRDVRAEWLGLDSSFKGNLLLKPEQQQAGFLIEYNQDLKKLGLSLFEQTWLSISIPVLLVENNLNLTQTEVSPGATFPHDIIEAFNQPRWAFSKIDGKRTRINTAEVKFTLGTHLISDGYYQMAYNSFLSIPAGNGQNPKYIFDPVVGNNRHIGLGAAIFYQFPLNRDLSNVAFCFFTNLEGTFFIRNKQFRTFDLKDKPWSRFLLFNEENGRQNIPGVNVLTLESVVRPYGIFDFSMGWRLKTEWLEAEIGYNLWGKSNEIVELRSPLDHPCQCFNNCGIAGDAPNTTASESTISQRAANDVDDKDNPVFIPIRENNIDLDSAEGGSIQNHKVHFSFGATHHSESADGIWGAGAFIDMPKKNSTPRTWGAWVKFGATF